MDWFPYDNGLCHEEIKRLLFIVFNVAKPGVLFLSKLGGKCTYSEFFWSVFSCIQTEYGEIFRTFPYSVRIRENVGHKNSRYEHFSRSVFAFHFFYSQLYNEKNISKLPRLSFQWLIGESSMLD